MPLMNKCTIEGFQQKYAEEEPLLKRVIAITEKARGTEDRKLIDPLLVYANVLTKLNRNDEAKQMNDRAVAIRAKQQAATPAPAAK